MMSPDDLPAALPSRQAACELLHLTEYKRVVKFVMLDGAQLSDAEDIAQNAFLELWHVMTDQPEKWADIYSPRAWVRGVALRMHRRSLASRARRHQLVPLDDAQQAERAQGDLSGLTALVVSLRAALAQLDEELRNVMLFTLDGFTAAEIARHLTVPQRTVTERNVLDLRKKARKALSVLLAEATTHTPEPTWTR